MSLFKYPSVYFLILANCVPLVGVLLLGWDLKNLLFLYWLESGIIGFYNVLKILFAAGPKGAAILNKDVVGLLPANIVFTDSKLASASYFILFFGLFMSVHALFLFAMLEGTDLGLTSNQPFFSLLNRSDVLVALGGLFFSHGYSFVANYIGRGEYKRISAPVLIIQPYWRIIVMHLVIIVGGALAFIYRDLLPVIFLLVIFKTIIDVNAHVLERKSFN